MEPKKRSNSFRVVAIVVGAISAVIGISVISTAFSVSNTPIQLAGLAVGAIIAFVGGVFVYMNIRFDHK